MAKVSVGLAAALAALPALAARDKLLAGDRAHAAALFRLHCAGCHGEDGAQPTAAGKSLGAPALRDPALINARTDEQLIAVALKGGPGPGSPAFSRYLTQLDAADLAALLRAPVPAVDDVFADAAAYTFKRYALAGGQLNRAEALAGPLSADERELVVFSVYGGKRGPLGPRLVAPGDHVGLDELPPKAKLGYLVFGPLPGGHGESALVALALDNDFRVRKLAGFPRSADLHDLSAAVVGKGSRDSASRRPFSFKANPGQAKALTRLYARAVEAAALAAKDEADRHLFDPPEITSKRPAGSE